MYALWAGVPGSASDGEMLRTGLRLWGIKSPRGLSPLVPGGERKELLFGYTDALW